MDWLHHIFQKSPEIALFLSLAVGYFIGQINFGKFQLGGVGGSLLAAVVISQAGVTAWKPWPRAPPRRRATPPRSPSWPWRFALGPSARAGGVARPRPATGVGWT